MDDPDLLLFILLTACSLFFYILLCGASKAFENLKVGELDLVLKKRSNGNRLKTLLEEADSVLFALRTAEQLTNIGFVILMTLTGVLVAQSFDYPLIGVMTAAFVIIIAIQFFIREIWARRFAASQSYRYVDIILLPLVACFRLVRPLSNWGTSLLARVSTHLRLNEVELDHEKIRAMVENGEGSNLQEDERAMIHSIIELGDTAVTEIMTPRTDMICVALNTDLEALIELTRVYGHSRVPLYSEDVDHILGIIHVKDLLSVVEQKHVDLKSLARVAYFVPETKKLGDLLRSFRQEKHHIAIVLDEYGGTAGLVTLEDVIEEIVGDIQDEYDKEQPLLEQIDEANYIIDAKIDLHELNDSLQISIPTEGEYESLRWIILSLTGYVPDEKENVHYENFVFVIEEVVGNRIVTVRMTINKGQKVAANPEEDDQPSP